MTGFQHALTRIAPRLAAGGRRWMAALAFCILLSAAVGAPAGDATLVEVKLGISTLSATDRGTLWKRVDEWATADALLDFCGTKMNIYRRGWVAVSPCVETPSLKKVGTIFRAKKANYLKILETSYPDAEKKKVFCDGLGSRLKDYQRIINAQIAEAKGMCDACLWC
ncbi:MAG: hypothetical protein ACT4N2_02310 [Hyphomicrobium sp.]